MTFGMVALLVLSLLTLFGVGQRVLDRLHLNDKAALIVMALLFLGGLVPPIAVGNVEIGLGGCVLPLALCVWVLVRAGSWTERIRTVVGAAVTAAAVVLMGMLLPAEPEQTVIDPNYLYGVAAGVIAYVLGRSRRAAFVCGVLGVLAADIYVGAANYAQGVRTTLRLGTGGALDTVVISGLIAVLLAEFVGEALERILRGRKKEAAR